MAMSRKKLRAITAAWQGAALLGVIGVPGGYMQIAVFTWMQQSVPPHMPGRAMSIVMGVAPLSATVIGALLLATPVRQIEAAPASQPVSPP